jgi:hypothetical protein
MKKHRRRTRARTARTAEPGPPVELAFTPTEEAFFSAGATLAEVGPIDSFEDLDDGQRRRGLLSRLFSRRAPN